MEGGRRGMGGGRRGGAGYFRQLYTCKMLRLGGGLGLG